MRAEAKAALFCVVGALAWFLPWLLPLQLGVVWLLGAQLAVVPMFMLGLKFPLVEALMQSMLYAGFSGFVFITSLVALQQSEAREEQRRHRDFVHRARPSQRHVRQQPLHAVLEHPVVAVKEFARALG